MPFFMQVYEVVKRIPKGKVSTYGQIAQRLGEPRKAKIVGWALHANPCKDMIPCHRVVHRNGELSKGYVFGGMDVQKRLLEDEGIIFSYNGTIDLHKYLWDINDQ